MTKKKVETLSPFDAADYLRDAESIAEFLSVSIEEANGDEAEILRAINVAARAQKRNMSHLAKQAGITRSGLYAALSGERNPSFVSVVRLLGAMGLTLSVTPSKT